MSDALGSANAQKLSQLDFPGSFHASHLWLSSVVGKAPFDIERFDIHSPEDGVEDEAVGFANGSGRDLSAWSQNAIQPLT